MFVVVVTFRIKAGCWDQFLDAVSENARDSLAQEKGCSRFDVCRDLAASEVLLYEIYRDAAAFEEHLKTPHFLTFDALSAPWIDHKVIRRFDLVAAL